MSYKTMRFPIILIIAILLITMPSCEDCNDGQITSFQLDDIEIDPTTDNRTLSFSWDLHAGAMGYTFELFVNGVLYESQNVILPSATATLPNSVINSNPIIQANVSTDCSEEVSSLDISNSLCNCTSPDYITVDSFYLADDPNGIVSDHILFSWNSVPQAESYDFSLTINGGDPVIQVSQIPDTSFLAISNLNLGDVLEAKVNSNCNTSCGFLSSESKTAEFINENGGATVDPLPWGRKVEDLCMALIEGDTCEFFRFSTGMFEDCASPGAGVSVPPGLTKHVYFKTVDICECVTDPCSLGSLMPCLTPKYLKRDYVECP